VGGRYPYPSEMRPDTAASTLAGLRGAGVCCAHDLHNDCRSAEALRWAGQVTDLGNPLDLQDESVLLFDMVLDDLQSAVNQLAAEDSGYHRRTAFRTFFAAAEGILFSLKQDLLEEAGDVGYSTGEMALLREESYGLSRKGELVVQPKFLRLDENFLFTMYHYTVTLDERFAVDVHARGWADFRNSLRVRHRLTHPKSPKDLTVTDAELRSLFSAAEWFKEVVCAALEEEGRLKLKTAAALRRVGHPRRR
jgi:hypothetical protein